MGLESVGDLALHQILSKLGPQQTAIVSCVSKRLKASASDEPLWSKFFLQDLHLSSPSDPQGQPLPSFRIAYALWREAFAMYPWPLVIRVKKCWDTIKGWLAINFPEAGATLQQGASEAQIRQLEQVLRVKLPLPTRVLYRFCDGQVFKEYDSSTSSRGNALGLIGGYSFYHHIVNVFLLPLNQVILETQRIIHHLNMTGSNKRSGYIVVAASSAFNEKLFFLNCANGQLYVGTRNLPIDGEMMPCVPEALPSSVHESSCNLQQQDALLLWLEEHGRRLQDGIIKLRGEGDMKSISQFPEMPPLCSTAITNGVKIRASAVFVPEAADLQHSNQKYWFTYSIRMSLPDGCFINGMWFNCCQLQKRHWIIRVNDTVVSDVGRDGVIGKYPLLRPGEKEFVYESCTPLPSAPGSVEGSFSFVPDRLAHPNGAPFEVEVGRFPLQLPDYIF